MDFDLLFIIGNHKCGTTAVAHAISEADIDAINTEEISVVNGLDVIFSVPSKYKQAVIHGHPDAIQWSGNPERDHKFISQLFARSQIILPSKNPLAVAISWLEYVRTRLIQAETETLMSNATLKQFIQLWSQYSGLDVRDLAESGFPHPQSEAIDNVIKWIEVIAKNTVWIWGQSYNLFFPRWPELKDAFDERRALNLEIANLVKSKKVLIFDSQAYSEVALAKLEEALGDQFARTLKETRQNVSMKSLDSMKLSDAYWAERALREICNFDFQIFEQAV